MLQVLHDLVAQSPLTTSLPISAQQSHAAINVHGPAINQQELISVIAPDDADIKIPFWVTSYAKPVAVSFYASPDVILPRTPQAASCAEASQPVWNLFTPSRLLTVSQTVPLLRQISHPHPLAQPVKTPTTICVQPLLRLLSFLVGSPLNCACLIGAQSSSVGRTATATKKAQRVGGFTFCGKPNQVACWLANLCDRLPGLAISDSDLWALGTGTHIHLPLRLAGLQQLSS
ncbi:hypothetical protein ABBQ32_009552 [Trebouxia sp. C0010 RCD-2024]